MDQSLSFLRDPYRFISKTCSQIGQDHFKTRILLKETVCLKGPDAARLFYDSSKFERNGAAPEPIRATLFGKGGVQGLDGEEHLHRKRLFMSLMSHASIEHLSSIVQLELHNSLQKWSRQSKVVLYDEFHLILTKAICRWAGIPLDEKETKNRAQQLVAMFDLAGSRDWGHIVSRSRRKKAEAWIEGVVQQLREENNPSDGSPAAIISRFQKLDGRLLDLHEAAVEVLNLLRPTVAVSVYMVYIAHALHLYPIYRQKFLNGDTDLIVPFLQEIRRHYPFFPAVIARVKTDFNWQGISFKKNTKTILDLYGTNHDINAWKNPSSFEPERFVNWKEDAFSFIPQGGGMHRIHHRCPGEWFTIEIMRQTLQSLVFRMDYSVPNQNLKLQWSRMPPVPKSRFLIEDVKIKAHSEVHYSPERQIYESP